MEALRRRRIAWNENSPTGDLARFVFCTAFSWQRAPNSEKGFSASDGRGMRYRFKGRRLHGRHKSRSLSALRALDGFDTLAAVVFDEAYRVSRAAPIPNEVVREGCKFVPHTNRHRFMLSDDVWNDGRVKDVTAVLRAAKTGN